MSGRGTHSRMQVEPHRLVELAASSETLLADMLDDWEVALVDISSACASLGDAAGTAGFASAYADAVAEAGDVVSSLTQSLRLGVEGLVAAAADAVRADETVAAELGRATHQVVDGFAGGQGQGRGHGQGSGQGPGQGPGQGHGHGRGGR